MKIVKIIILAACLVAGSLHSVLAAQLTADMLGDLSKRFKFFVVLEEPGRPPRFVYADRDHVHLYRLEDGKRSLEWETTNLGARASALFVADVDGNGEDEIVIASTQGRILIYDTNKYDLLWENLQDPFKSIETMTSANIDSDPQQELIFVADELLFIYDGLRKTIEWQSQDKFQADEIILGNVDDDDQLEIILNTGFVIDSRFYTIDFEGRSRFGDRIWLMDFNGDDIPEVIGETNDFTVRIFDIYAEREIW